MYMDCVHFRRPGALCQLSQRACNRSLHMTCGFERVKPGKKKTKKEEEKTK
jgi:hypothetical protein